MSYTATGLGSVGMPRGFRGFACALVATATIFLPSGASSAQTTEVLGGDATLYRILVADADGSPVDGTRGETLVLEVARAGETPARFMVPGTEDANAEVAPSLSFSESTRTLYVAWEHRVNSLHSRIQAMGFQPESGFSPIVDMIGNPFYAKRSPRVALTSEVAAWREEQAAEGEASAPAETVFDQKGVFVVEDVSTPS